MAGFENDVIVGSNLNFDDDGAKPHLGILNAAGKLPIGTGNLSPIPEILGGVLTSPNNSITFGYSSPNITAVVNTNVVPDLHTATWIVNPVANMGGNSTTIQNAINNAVSGETVFIMAKATPYTENLTLKPGVSLTAFNCDEYNNVTIAGTLTFTQAGTVALSGLKLTTNGAVVLAVTGTAASILILDNCTLNLTNANGITFSSSSASAALTLNRCTGIIATTGITYFVHTSAGVLNINYCRLANTGLSTTNSTASAGKLMLRYSALDFAITTSGTVVLLDEFCEHDTAAISTIALTHGGANSSASRGCYFETGTASAISISTNYFIHTCILNSANTNIVTGAGTVVYTPTHMSNVAEGNFNVTTQTVRPFGPSVRVGCINSGAANTLTVDNGSNTASSTSNCAVQVAGGTAGDPTYQSVVAGVTTWTWGTDNSDADSWVMSQGTALGTNNVIHATTAGEINYPLQPAFLAVLTTTVNDVTGDGTLYSVIYDTEIFDQGADFNLGTSIFTAPVTGRYQFCVAASLIGGTIISGPIVFMTSSNRTYRLSMPLGAGITSTSQASLSVLADMDAADTIAIGLQATDTGGKVDDVAGTASSAFRNWFSGQLSV